MTVGRAGLSAVLPVLSACGVQCCPLPSALFSAHTGGFGPVERLDTAAHGEAALAHYKREGVAFDAIYVGYLYAEAQFRLAEAAFAAWPGAYKIVDPALADGGRLYSGLGDEAVRGMQGLCQKADLVTPNATESALLLGLPPDGAPTQAQLESRLAALSQAGAAALITSAPTEGGGLCVLGCGPRGEDSFRVPVNRLPQNYPGTGDVFTAAVAGAVLRGAGLRQAAQKAADFVERAIAATLRAGGEVRDGVQFEPLLPLLAQPL